MIAPRWRKVIRDLWDNKSRTVLVVVSIAIGVFAFGGLFIARVIGDSDLTAQYIQTDSPDIIMSLPPFDDHFVRWMARQPHVSGAQGRAVYNVKLIEPGKTHNITLNAYDDFEAIQIGRIYSQEGRWPPGKDEIEFERSTLHLTNLAPGDEAVIEMLDGQRYNLKLVGTIHDLNAIPGTIRSQITGYISFRTLNRLGLPAHFNQMEITIDRDYLAASGRPVLETLDVIANDLQRQLQRDGIRVGSVTVRDGQKHWAADMMQGVSTILIVVGLGSLFLSGFLVVNTISGLLAQQKRQIGIMKVIGASRPQIIGIYLVMVVFLGLVALVIAIPASLALAHLLLFTVVSNFLNFDVQHFYVPTNVLILQVAVAILSPILSALVPILNGTRMTAAEAISDYVVQAGSGLIDRLLVKIRGLSRPLLISIRNTFRRKVRLMMTLITLTAAGTLFMSIMNVRAALETDVNDRLRMSNFDVQIYLDGLYDRTGFERRLEEQIPGVAQVEGWVQANVQRIRPGGDKSGTFAVYGLPYDSPFVDPLMQSGQWLPPHVRPEQNDIVVTTDLVQDEPDIQVGDWITLELNHEKADWRVAGILISSNPVAYAHYDDLSHFMKLPDKTSILSIRTLQHDAEAENAASDAILEFLDLRDIGVARSMTRAQLFGDTQGGLNVLISVLIGMAIIVAAVGGLGLAGTMSLNVLERTREIGVMRAVGASTATIRGLFILEGVIIGILSAVIALPLSVPASVEFGNILGAAIAKRPLPYTPTLQGPVTWFLIILAISTAASLMPAQRATQISVREALAYE